VQTGQVGDTKVAKGENGWVAANDNGAAAGNYQGDRASASKSSSSGRDVESGTIGETTVVKGEQGWVAANENGVAAGNFEGDGAAVNKEGEGVSWGEGDDWEGGNWEDDDWEGGVIVVEEDEWNTWENEEAWKVAAGVTVGIAIGTMIAQPPPTYTTIYVSSSPYYYAEGVWYEPVYNGTTVVYQVMQAPVGAVIATLPPGCTVTTIGNVSYQQCTGVYYTKVSTGWQVVVLPR
jgi:hypothetical protein